MTDLTTLAIQGLQIIWINILLSGDNAVVIALACKDLPAHKRRVAILAGSSVAVALRIVFTIFIVELLKLPYVKLAGALLLFWIAIELARNKDDDKNVRAAGSVWAAVRTIALADAVMSLDNVVAVAAAAHNSLPLIVFGIALSVPLIVFGSTLVLRLLQRFPVLVVAGSTLLGYVAGEMLASEPRLEAWIGTRPEGLETWFAALGALAMLAVAGLLRWRGARREEDRLAKEA